MNDMSQTIVNLGYVPKNRGEYSSTASYYKDNIVQYNGSSYICNPPNYDPDTAPTASITGVAPYASDPAVPNTGWAVFCNDSSGVGEGVYDVSVDHTTDNQPKIYASLSAALNDIPAAKNKGGMEIRFIFNNSNYAVDKEEGITTQPAGTLITSSPTMVDGTYKASQLLTYFSTLPTATGAGNAVVYYKEVDGTYTTWTITLQSSDNKYVQFRYMSSSTAVADFTNVANWQGVDDEPTAGSDNLIKSGGVYDETHTENYVDKTSTAVDEHYIITNVSVGSVVDIENPTEAGNFEYIIFQVLAGEKIKVKGQGVNAPRLWAFIDTDKKMIENSDNSLYLNDYVTLTAPANGYFISNSIMNSQDYPHSVKVEKYISVKESIAQLDEKIEGIQEGIQEDIINANNTIDEDEYRDNVLSSINSLRIGLRPKVMFYGYDEGGRWLNVGNPSYIHRLFVLKSGDEIKIKAGTAGSHYSFLKDAVKPVNLAAMNYVDGYTRTTIAANAEVTVNAPADCFLYVLIAYNNDTRYVPASLSVNGVEQLEVLENQDVREYFPDGVLKNDATNKRLTFYGRRKGTSQYFAFRIQHKIDHSDLEYADLWHLTKGHLCNYSNGVFTDVCETIDDAENEMAIKFSGKADFTGGYHGDERIDIDSSSFVHFFADGKLITDLSTDFEVECSSFDYVQFSTLHETTNDGSTPVTGHPIVAYHFKKSSFENGKFIVENSVKMASAQTVTTAFAGLFCTDKDVASIAIVPFAQEIQMSGNNSQKSANNKQDASVLFYNGTNKVECIVEGHFEQGYDDKTDVNYYIVWDRSVDSKYYRGNSLSKEFAQGDIIRNKFIAEFL